MPTLVSVDVHPAPSPPSQEVGWWRAAGRAISGLLGLIWAFAPEIVAGFFGAFIGLVIGLALGVGLTSELLQGGGAWGRAGPIALILPVFSFVGPALICSMIGATVPPTIALAVHALVLLGATSPKRVALRPVVLATAIGVFGPALVLGLFSDAHLAGAFVALFFAPFTGTLGLLAGAAFVGGRAMLAGRSVGQWWRDADGSMGVAMLTLSLFAWLGILVPFAIVFVFPAVVLALVLAFVLGARLFVAGKRRAVVVVVLGVNLLFTALLTWAVGSMIANRTKATPPHAAVEPSRGDVLACVAARTGPQRHYHIGPG